ncbi:MAG TPA: hypothetical protein VIJ33_07990 [Solirubrobacteraceae bacterium]
MAGYDTANYIYAVYQGADAKYGTPGFWVRYFSPCPNTPFPVNAVKESQAAWDSGGGHIGPISSPGPARISANSSADGFADGQTFAASLQQASDNVSQLRLPSNGHMYCWLDMEPGDVLNSNYWNGWAHSLNTWNWKRQGIYPLYAALYTRTCKDNGCQAATGKVLPEYVCFGIWSQQPQRQGSVSHPPTWAADSCAHCILLLPPPTLLWQFTIAKEFGDNVDVDLDVAAPGINYSSYTFYLTSRP